MPFYKRVWSIRTLFLLIISGVSVFLVLVLLWAGAGIMNSIITQYSTEIMTEKLYSLIHPVDMRYATLQRIGLEDSQQHLAEIRDAALKEFAGYRYKETGSVFVVGRNQDLIQSPDFNTRADNGFAEFFSLLQSGEGKMKYVADRIDRFAVYQFYPPWDSYIGLAINQGELFALKNLFINITGMLLVAVLLATFLFSRLIRYLMINPLLNLTNYANQVSRGNYDAELTGNFILELGALRIDLQQMVVTLRQKMEQTTAQLQIIREREAWLDDALAALQDSERKYRTIYNAPSDAILIYAPDEDKILDTNKAALDMFGMGHDQIRGATFADLSSGAPSFDPREMEAKITAAMDGAAQLFEWMLHHHGGEFFWAEISLQASYLEGKKRIIAVVRNIHARKMAEQDLASEKERLAVTLRSIGDGVITTDVRGRIVMMNSVAETLTGWQQAEAAGRLFSEVFHIQHQTTGQPCENPVARVLGTSQKTELADDTILVARDGTIRNIADSGAPICDPQSKVIGVVLVFRDVTDEKRMEEELFKVRKLESVGVLAGGIAHDFNNILVAILGNLGLARQKLDSRGEAEALLRNTEKAALRAKDLTAQLLTFSRGGEPVIKATSIGAMIRESAEFVLRGSNVKATFAIPEDLWLVNADSGQIGQVIQNIVLNARQAIPEGGTVDITCSNCQNCSTGPDPIRHRCVRVRIHDNGPGIPADILPKIFDPYFSTRDDGSGLGLAICHSIIKKHGGHLSVESEPGAGTTFFIQLPVSGEQEIDQQSEIPMHIPAAQRARILVMDDDAMILELAQQMLVYLGHEVVTCTDGEAALDLYRDAMAGSKPFDLVIMDLTIPGGMGGEKAIQELLRLDPDVRAIVSSGYSNDRVMANYAQHGFKAVVVKPYQMEDLDQAVRKTLQSGPHGT